jgi:hypothetical protein
VARRDDTRDALYRKPVVVGVYRLDAGVWLDDVCNIQRVRGVMGVLVDGRGVAISRELVAFVPSSGSTAEDAVGDGAHSSPAGRAVR